MQTELAGVVGLTFKGMYEEIQKKRGRAVDNHIRAMLMMQGYNEAKDLAAEERVSILERWKMEVRNESRAHCHGIAETPESLLAAFLNF
jgi:hypothetical protein